MVFLQQLLWWGEQMPKYPTPTSNIFRSGTSSLYLPPPPPPPPRKIKYPGSAPAWIGCERNKTKSPGGLFALQEKLHKYQKSPGVFFFSFYKRCSGKKNNHTNHSKVENKTHLQSLGLNLAHCKPKPHLNCDLCQVTFMIAAGCGDKTVHYFMTNA